jgi:hypothetical protein
LGISNHPTNSFRYRQFEMNLAVPGRSDDGATRVVPNSE